MNDDNPTPLDTRPTLPPVPPGSLGDLRTDSGHAQSLFDDHTIRAQHHPAVFLLSSKNTFSANHMIDLASPSDDDFTTAKPPLIHPLRRIRRSSHFERWIQDQQSAPSSPTSTFEDLSEDASIPKIGTPSNPYLAYPHLSRPVSLPTPIEEDGSTHSYDLLEDNDIPDPERSTPTSQLTYSTSPPTSPHLYPASILSRPSSPLSTHTSPATPPLPSLHSLSPSRKSLFRGALAMPLTHGRSSSVSTFGISTLGISNRPAGTPEPKITDHNPWRWRPSVLGHFSPQATPRPDLDTPAPPRLSTSSMATQTTTTTTSSYFTAPATLSSPNATTQAALAEKLSFVRSLRSRARSRLGSSAAATSTYRSPSVWSLPGQQSHTPQQQQNRQHEQPPGKDDDASALPPLRPTAPYIAYAPASASRVSLSRVSFAGTTRHARRKKKLIVVGIGEDETARFEAFKRWCESFGEVSKITRMPNGELHVHFKKAEVADTVCRVRAKVHIADVGSVFISWYTGKKD